MAKIEQMQIIQAQERVQQMFSALRKKPRLYSRRRARLADIIGKENREFQRVLNRFPVLPKKYKKTYGEFKRSFDLFQVQLDYLPAEFSSPLGFKVDLFQVQLDYLLAEFSSPFGFKVDLYPPKSMTTQKQLEYWEDLIDPIEDHGLGLERQERDGFLSILKILDTIERLNGYQIPNTGAGGEIFSENLLELQEVTVIMGTVIATALRRRKIDEVPLVVGMYPPLETTRILSRDDDQINDDVVISKIVEKGYTWRSSVLRKASVVIHART